MSAPRLLAMRLRVTSRAGPNAGGHFSLDRGKPGKLNDGIGAEEDFNQLLVMKQKPFPRLHSLVPVAMFFTALLHAEPRTFTDQQGRKLDAELISHNGNGLLELKRADGQVFKLPAATFSAADQAHIQEFVSKNPARVDYHFDVKAATTKVTGVRRDFGYKKVKNELWAYKVDIRNLSRDTVGGLKVEYRVFVRNEADGSFAEMNAPLDGYHSGEDSLAGPMRYNEIVSFTTREVSIDSVDYLSGSRKNRHVDSLRGLMLRIKDAGGKVVHEYVSPITTLKDKTWDSIPKSLEIKSP